MKSLQEIKEYFDPEELLEKIDELKSQIIVYVKTITPDKIKELYKTLVLPMTIVAAVLIFVSLILDSSGLLVISFGFFLVPFVASLATGAFFVIHTIKKNGIL